jgi:hypothetical protein
MEQHTEIKRIMGKGGEDGEGNSDDGDNYNDDNNDALE